MNVVRHKIKLVDRQEGAVDTFLTGIPQDVAEFLEKAVRRYADPETRFAVISEPYVAVVDDLKKEVKKGQRDGKTDY